MKRIILGLMVYLLCSLAAVPAMAEEGFTYACEPLGFSLAIPGLSPDDVAVEETEGGVSFFHAPSRAAYGGLICTIEAVSPRSDFFAGGYDDVTRQVIAMGKDRIFLLKSPGGGVNTSGELLADFRRVASHFTLEALRTSLKPSQPDSIPVLSQERHRAYLPAEGDRIRPDAPLTRGELAEMLYALLDADNKAQTLDSAFSDTEGLSCAQAAAYLASYGILTGYGDGTFRPEAPVSRAAFAVLLHRVQFAAPVGQYGDGLTFPDVPDTHWAYDAISSAAVLEWMNGKADGLFHPEGEITRAQAVTAINRLLGRDESAAPAEGESPFRDLDSGHWAYGNLLEAAGMLQDPVLPVGPVPQGADVSFYLDDTAGWAVSGGQLLRTRDGGRIWSPVGETLPCSVLGLQFFDQQRGVLLGETADCPLVLLGTADGGETWHSILEDQAAVERHLAARQIADREVLLGQVASVSLRPASSAAAYLTVRFTPYESIYVREFQAVKQSVITAAEIA